MATDKLTGPQIIDRSMLTQHLYIALVSAEPVLNRLALYQSAEDNDRHTDAEMSILRYALAGYLTGMASERGLDEPIIEPFGDEVDVEWTDESGTDQKITVEYPAWLADFFADDENFALLKPDSVVPLAEIIDSMREHVESGSYGQSDPDPGNQEDDEIEEIEDDDAETDTAPSEDSGEESADDQADRVFADAGREADSESGS